MNKLSLQERAQIIGVLVEGTSMRAVTRFVDCSINTVIKLPEDVGAIGLASGRDNPQHQQQARPVRRNMVLLLLQRKERRARRQRHPEPR